MKKLIKIFTSRLLYLFLGLFLSIAVISAYAAWNSTVSNNEPLTTALWNDVVAKLVELDNSVDTIGTRNNCEWVGGGRCNQCRYEWFCPVGKYAAGVAQRSTGETSLDYVYVYCCDIR